MPTVILGGGIIGTSIAYYLSENQNAGDIHIIESSSQLFSAASGYAAGFMAKDWFAPSLAPLGELSFNLHSSLAAENGGAEKWGYMKGTALSLDTTAPKKDGVRGDDWLRAGTSRAETAAGSNASTLAEAPGWLTKQQGTKVERISDEDTVAQVDPLRLATFLIDTAQSRGVKVHHPSKATSLVTDKANGTITGVKVINLSTKTESTIPCTNLIVCTGPWTPQVFADLFPSSQVSLPITSLAGYSLVVRSPRYTLEHEQKTHNGQSHAVFTTQPPTAEFCPEIFSRHGGEIYIAGLNSTEIPLPARVEDTYKVVDQKEKDRLKAVAVRLMGKLADGSVESTEGISNTDDLEIVREGLCFRPVAERGTPVVSRVEDGRLGGVRADQKGGVFVASGHGPWGITLSLGTGRVMADLVRGVQPAADVSGLGCEYIASRPSKL